MSDNPLQNNGNAEALFGFGPFLFSNKIELIGLLNFIVTALGLLTLLYYFFVGIKIEIIPPPWIFAFADQSEGEVGKPIARFAMSINILNTSRSTDTAVLKDITFGIAKDIASQAYPYHLHEFQSVRTYRSKSVCRTKKDLVDSVKENTIGQGVPAILDDGSRLFNCFDGATKPYSADVFQLGPEQDKDLGIGYNKALSGVFTVSPAKNDVRLLWKDFVDIVDAGRASGIISVVLLNGEIFSYDCSITFDGGDRSYVHGANFSKVEGIACRARARSY